MKFLKWERFVPGICIHVSSCSRSFCCTPFQYLVDFIFVVYSYFFQAFNNYTPLSENNACLLYISQQS